jgi:hypothetical protein
MLDSKIIALELRPYLEMPTSLLITIKKNLIFLLKNPIIGADPIFKEITRNRWTTDLESINRELIFRN